MAIRVNIEADNVEEFRSILALLGSTAIPREVASLSATVSPAAANDTDKPAARTTRRAAKTEETPSDAAPAAASAPAGNEAQQPSAAGGDQPAAEPEQKPVDPPAEQPAETPAAAGAGADGGAEPDLGTVARAKLREVMAKFTPADMHAIIKAQGVTAVKDIPDAKLPAVIADCDAKLATYVAPAA